MGRPKGRRNKTTRYGGGEKPKKCRYCGATGSAVTKKDDRRFANHIHTTRRRRCHDCEKTWISHENVTKADHPELFTDG